MGKHVRKPYHTWLNNQILCFIQDRKKTIYDCLQSFAKGLHGQCRSCQQGRAIKDRYVEMRKLYDAEKQGRRIDMNRSRIVVHTIPVARVKGSQNARKYARGAAV